MYNGTGIINATTGKVYSFLKIANLTNKICKNKMPIIKLKRIGPMPHKGYRPFNNTLLKKILKKYNLKIWKKVSKIILIKLNNENRSN